MNWSHLKAVFALRWRIRVNQIKRAGTFNVVIVSIFAALLAIGAACAFFSSIPIGAYVLNTVPAWVLMVVWDGLAAAFLMFWTIGIVADLQRSESLSPGKFLHLPVSLSGVFFVNYLSSLATLSSVVFLPVFVGLSLGLAAGRGPMLLVALPLIAAFFFMVSALTYQFRGWLAALMSNPRRRRTVIVGVTLAFVLIAQLPNLINMWVFSSKATHADKIRIVHEQSQLQRQRDSGAITKDEFASRKVDLENESLFAKEENERHINELKRWLLIANQAIPPGWLPWGVSAAAEGRLVPTILGLVGMSAIGMLSLWRAYRTTVRYYTADNRSVVTAKTPRHAIPPRTLNSRGFARTLLVEKRIPRISEYASAIATCGCRSLLRAPEAKMMFLSPVILVLVFGSMLFRESMDVSKPIRSLVAIGAIAMTYFGMVQFVGNQFGFDRAGFRVFVLCPAPRRDVLFGKNLAMAPFALGMAWLVIVFVQVLRPMYWDHLIAMVPQSFAMYLVFCLMSNWLSILAPMPIAAGSMRPKQPTFSLVLLHLVFTFAMPLALAPTAVPWLLEYLLQWANGGDRLPLFLPGAVIGLGCAALAYYAILNVQGELLQRRELEILDVVTKIAE